MRGRGGYSEGELGVNCYLFYDGLLKVIVMQNVINEVQSKEKVFYARLGDKREQVKQLIR